VPNERPPVQSEYSRPQGCLLRLFWLAFGNLALLALAALIVERSAFSAIDGIYWLVVVALAVARYLDIRRFDGLTIDGEPATPTHLRRYLMALFTLGGGLWAAVHVVSRLV
jgi:hypothetical protein